MAAKRDRSFTFFLLHGVVEQILLSFPPEFSVAETRGALNNLLGEPEFGLMVRTVFNQNCRLKESCGKLVEDSKDGKELKEPG
ncbi:hypothetical protein DUI87_14003 [Hirundo rustica rustica]|uniref:Uncharacterized protein n=1 Tax=Hirundo rustica rustica TaxID=333673 RepID=A0A3M0K7C2_HIRRU|nr:hypothetical protein DUI87_14003 [Hirundo rustica rustica]